MHDPPGVGTTVAPVTGAPMPKLGSADQAAVPRVGYLVYRVERRLRARLDEEMRVHGVSTPEYVTLSLLRERDGLSCAQLARWALVTPQAMNLVISGPAGAWGPGGGARAGAVRVRRSRGSSPAGSPAPSERVVRTTGRRARVAGSASRTQVWKCRDPRSPRPGARAAVARRDTRDIRRAEPPPFSPRLTWDGRTGHRRNISAYPRRVVHLRHQSIDKQLATRICLTINTPAIEGGLVIGRRTLAALAAAALVVALALTPASSGAQTTTSQHLTGTTSDGSQWIADVPSPWNGTVLLYSHGFGPLVAADAPDPTYPAVSPPRGLRACRVPRMTRTARGGPWTPPWETSSDAHRRSKTQLPASPRHVIAFGTSMGGLISALEDRAAQDAGSTGR